MATFCGLRSALRLHRSRQIRRLLHQNHTNRDQSNQRPPSPTSITSSLPRSSSSLLSPSHLSALTHDGQSSPWAKGDWLHTSTFESNDRHERLGVFALDGTGHAFHLNNIHRGFGLDTGVRGRPLLLDVPCFLSPISSQSAPSRVLCSMESSPLPR